VIHDIVRSINDDAFHLSKLLVSTMTHANKTILNNGGLFEELEFNFGFDNCIVGKNVVDDSA
jgi:hypothetical protein